ncbi:MAG: alpha/beta fold hydrolase [Hyphomicrobiales bacterium]
MEPRIQYTATSDGVSIAYWVMGDGMPFIHMPPIPWSHLQLEWEDPAYRRWFERLALNTRLVCYDSRGSGLSDRTAAATDMEPYLRDVDAVADRLGFEKFALMGVSPSGPMAIAYAATRPERVTYLVLWCSGADAQTMETPETLALHQLARANWELFTETMAHAMVAGWAAPEQARAFARVMRAAVDQEVAGEFYDSPCGKALHLLPEVKAPTLILHRREAKFPPISAVRQVAIGIREAELVLLEGGSILPFVGDTDSVHHAIERFLGLPISPGDDQPNAFANLGGLRTILFTDLEAHTAMMSRLGDQRGREVLRDHERITRQALRDHGGAEVKTMGDGFMASFTSAQRALDCAIALQHAFAEHNARNPDAPLHVRVGINAGEPIAEADDLFGSAVITASRIAAQAVGGEVLVANVVRELVAGKGYLFAERGETVLRGFEDSVRLYELRWHP